MDLSDEHPQNIRSRRNGVSVDPGFMTSEVIRINDNANDLQLGHYAKDQLKVPPRQSRGHITERDFLAFKSAKRRAAKDNTTHSERHKKSEPIPEPTAPKRIPSKRKDRSSQAKTGSSVS